MVFTEAGYDAFGVVGRYFKVLMTAAGISSRSGRRLNAKGRARRARLAAARRRKMYLSAAAAFAVVVGAPLSIAGYMGVETGIPGVEATKSFLAMMTDRSPGERTKAELTKTKQRPAAAPKQRALGKVTKPEPPKEFVEALASPVPKMIEDVPLALAPVTSLGPMLITPQLPGGIVIPTQSPPPGGGGGPTPPSDEPPPTEPPPNDPPPNDPPPNDPPPSPPIVPEPGTWATMLLGFGMTGWMIRRRRRKVAALQSA